MHKRTEVSSTPFINDGKDRGCIFDFKPYNVQFILI